VRRLPLARLIPGTGPACSPSGSASTV